MNKRYYALVETYSSLTAGVDGVEKYEGNLPEALAMAFAQSFLAQVRNNPKQEMGMIVTFRVEDIRYEFDVVMTHDGGLVSVRRVG